MRRPVAIFPLPALIAVTLLAGCTDRQAPLEDSRTPPSDGWLGCSHPQVVMACTKGWCTIPAGCFPMGASSLCAGPYGHKETFHLVVLTRAFEIASFETTQSEFKASMGYNPSSVKSCSTCPVETVTWHEAAAYCNALSHQAGFDGCYACTGSGQSVTCKPSVKYGSIYDCMGYRLPTEAEWEYSARAGSISDLYSGDLDKCDVSKAADAIAWYRNNSGNQPHPVGTRQANAWGLYDMAGNVEEWITDGFDLDLGTQTATDPVAPIQIPIVPRRGGNFQSDAGDLRHSFRTMANMDQRLAEVGFRCARTR